MRSEGPVFGVRFWLLVSCLFAASIGCFARAAAATRAGTEVEATPIVRVGVMTERLRRGEMTERVRREPVVTAAR